MQYLEVTKLEKYQPGYKDRSLIWIKVYFTLVNGSYEFEMLHEIDKWRFICFCMVQTQAKRPIPLDKQYLSIKGFNFKSRPLELTVESLLNAQLIDVIDVTETSTSCNETVTQSRVEKSRVDKKRVEKEAIFVSSVFNRFLEKTGKKYQLTPERKKLILRLKDIPLDDIFTAIDNFSKDTWDERPKYMDLVYCLGQRSGKDNFEQWLNYKPEEDHGREKQPSYHRPIQTD